MCFAVGKKCREHIVKIAAGMFLYLLSIGSANGSEFLEKRSTLMAVGRPLSDWRGSWIKLDSCGQVR